MEGHPKVHAHYILDDLYHAPMRRPERAPTQHGVASRRMGCGGPCAELPEMYADVHACRRVRRTSAASDGAGSRMMFEEDDEVLRGVERKVLDAHTEVVHDESRLLRDAARQPRRDQPSRRPELLQRLREQPSDQLVRMAVPRQRDGRATPRVQGSPGCTPLEQQIQARGRRRCEPAWGTVYEPIGGEFNAVLEGEGGCDEAMELLANLLNNCLWGQTVGS